MLRICGGRGQRIVWVNIHCLGVLRNPLPLTKSPNLVRWSYSNRYYVSGSASAQIAAEKPCSPPLFNQEIIASSSSPLLLVHRYVSREAIVLVILLFVSVAVSYSWDWEPRNRKGKARSEGKKGELQSQQCLRWLDQQQQNIFEQPSSWYDCSSWEQLADSSHPPLVSIFKMFTSWMLLSIRAPPLSIKLAIVTRNTGFIHINVWRVHR